MQTRSSHCLETQYGSEVLLSLVPHDHTAFNAIISTNPPFFVICISTMSFLMSRTNIKDQNQEAVESLKSLKLGWKAMMSRDGNGMEKVLKDARSVFLLTVFYGILMFFDFVCDSIIVSWRVKRYSMTFVRATDSNDRN